MKNNKFKLNSNDLSFSDEKLLELAKENNILVRIDEDKKELTPPNWRRNKYKCEHKGKEMMVGGSMFIERFS